MNNAAKVRAILRQIQAKADGLRMSDKKQTDIFMLTREALRLMEDIR